MAVLRVTLALLGLFCCYRLSVDSAKTGYSRLLSMFAIIETRVEPVDEAVRVTPNDPEAHYTRALELVNFERLGEAVVELREAIRLRPHHYYEWLDLGVTLDRLDDREGALSAIRESVRLAPSFAQPRWQLGSLLYREGKYQEAFAELRLGAKSSRNLFDSLLALAWVAADGDGATMDSLIKPEDPRSHLLLADYLARHQKGSDAVRHVQAAGKPRDEIERLFLNRTIVDLIATKQLVDAYVVWATTHSSDAGNSVKDSPLLNGDFVNPINLNDPGFGWQLAAIPQVRASIDPSGPIVGTRSICLDFNGEYPPGTPVLSQLILVQPKTRYTLTFTARTEGIVSGGPPMMVVFDSDYTKILGQSGPLPVGTNQWSQSQMSFSTEEHTLAIILSLQRLACSQSPCPVFGKLWLSKFSLARV